MLGGSAVLFALVMGLYAAVILRPGFGARLSRDRWIAWGGLALPIPVLAALTAAALWVGEGALHRGAEPIRIGAEASRYAWRFTYPDRPPSDVLTIKAGQVVELEITSTDVIHSFWVPRLGGKMDAIPGRVNRLRLMADTPGSYGGLCAEYCGTGHSQMVLTVEVTP